MYIEDVPDFEIRLIYIIADLVARPPPAMAATNELGDHTLASRQSLKKMKNAELQAWEGKGVSTSSSEEQDGVEAAPKVYWMPHISCRIFILGFIVLMAASDTTDDH